MAIEVHGSMIRVPQGDTGIIKFVADDGEITEQDKGVFTLARRDGTAVLRQILQPDMETKTFQTALAYEDTEKLRPGTYAWSFAMVKDAVFDDGGRLTDAKSKHTAVLMGRMDILPVAGGMK